ncbi:hypothetical protein N9N67_05605 [Bacteriovoracaceae bacterium]|nr:hypothetical protein [Bacteriovoracaceae bacterium]
MKNIIDMIMAPEYSFTAVVVLFILMIKYVDKIATKKFGYSLLLGMTVFIGWLFTDNVFRLNFFATNDNVPIIFLVFLVVWSCWFSLYKGIQNDNRIAAGGVPLEAEPENREKVWSWPNLVYTELFAIIACTIFLIVWAIVFKSPLEEPANPTWAPNPAKAPWYFLGLQEMLVYFDPWLAGVLLPGLIIVGLVAIPYMDVNPKGNGYYTFRERKFAITTFLFGWLVLWVFLIIIGTFLRGPNWVYYGPFEVWDAHKVLAANNVNISEYFWIKLLNQGLPKNILVREIAGIIMTVGYFVVGIPLFNKFFGNKYLKRMGMIRYYLMVMLIFMTLTLPIKMYLRWSINLKYIIFMPEFEFNI